MEVNDGVRTLCLANSHLPPDYVKRLKMTRFPIPCTRPDCDVPGCRDQKVGQILARLDQHGAMRPDRPEPPSMVRLIPDPETGVRPVPVGSTALILPKAERLAYARAVPPAFGPFPITRKEYLSGDGQAALEKIHRHDAQARRAHQGRQVRSVVGEILALAVLALVCAAVAINS